MHARRFACRALKRRLSHNEAEQRHSRKLKDQFENLRRIVGVRRPAAVHAAGPRTTGAHPFRAEFGLGCGHAEPTRRAGGRYHTPATVSRLRAQGGRDGVRWEVRPRTRGDGCSFVCSWSVVAQPTGSTPAGAGRGSCWGAPSRARVHRAHQYTCRPACGPARADAPVPAHRLPCRVPGGLCGAGGVGCHGPRPVVQPHVSTCDGVRVCQCAPLRPAGPRPRTTPVSAGLCCPNFSRCPCAR